MYKNQLQELAQRSCFNLPSYSCIREGPDHAPRFKACVNFNGEMFESPNYCTTLRQAEHSAAEVALNVLSTRGPSRSLTARVLDETGIYKNLLQETAHRAGLKLPVYTTVRSGPGHVPTFTCSVELAGMNFTGEAAKTKKQAEKNAAIAAWSALKRNLGSISLMTNNKEGESSVDQEQQEEQAAVTRLLSNFRQSNKEEHSRNLRRRSDYQTQARRSRMVRGAHNNHTPHGHSARDNNNVSSTSSTDSVVQNLQHWRLIDDLLTDLVTPQVSSSSQKQKCFASLLPPPPPLTESKILTPTATLNKLANSSCSFYSGSSYNNRPIPVQVRGNGKSQLAAPLGDHQKDEEEWLGKKINEMEEGLQSYKPSASNNYLNSNSSKSGIYGSSGAYSSRKFPMSSNPIQAPAATTPSTTSDLMARRSWSNEGFVNPCSHRIAPAVQIRSVIPVCAAPPVAIRPPSPIGPPIPRMKESITNSTASSSSTNSLSAAALKEFDSSSVDSSSARSKFNLP